MLKLRGKLTICICLLVFIGSSVSSVLGIYALKNVGNELENKTYSNFDDTLVTSVQMVVSELDANRQFCSDKKTDKSEEMVNAKRILREGRYGENNEGYFWADLEDGMCAVHINSDYEGINRLNIEDCEGTQLIKELINVGNSSKNGGFSEFYFIKPGIQGEFKKSLYI